MSEEFEVGQTVWAKSGTPYKYFVAGVHGKEIWVKISGGLQATGFLSDAAEWTTTDPKQPAEPVPQKCPFCGSVAIVHEYTNNEWDVRCSNVIKESRGCCFHAPYKPTRLEAIQAWNSIRVALEPPGVAQRLALEWADLLVKSIVEEREACAKIAEDLRPKDNFLGGYSVQDLKRAAADEIAATIRSRGQQ